MGEKILLSTDKESAWQNKEKHNQAVELFIANKELVHQNEEKEKRAAELVIANKELIFQNEEKEKRAAELVIANKELLFQNEEKEKRAAELVIANKELVFQNEEKEKRAAELTIANKELVFQNEEKENRAAELVIANKELEAFAFISSHDLQEPLRKIQTFASYISTNEAERLTDKGKNYLERIHSSAHHMQVLINDLLAYSRTTTTEKILEHTDLQLLVEEIIEGFREELEQKGATIQATGLCKAAIIPFQFRQLLQNIIANALKFTKPGVPPHIVITSAHIKGDKCIHENLSPSKDYCHVSIRDNGIGFEPEYNSRIFQIFQRLNDKTAYEGTGIGLTIVKKIVDNHKGIITATGVLGEGATFDIYLPATHPLT